MNSTLCQISYKTEKNFVFSNFNARYYESLDSDLIVILILNDISSVFMFLSLSFLRGHNLHIACTDIKLAFNEKIVSSACFVMMHAMKSLYLSLLLSFKHSNLELNLCSFIAS